MLCPSCRAEIDFSRPDCASCGVDLLAAFEARARGPEEPKASKPRRASKTSPGRKAALLGMCLAASAVVAWVLRGSDASNARAPQFAYDPPLGWVVEKPGAPAGAWTEILRFSQGPAVLQVLVGGHEPLAMRSAKAFAEESFQATEIRVEGTYPLAVGGVAAWEMVVTGRRALVKGRDGPFKGRAVMLPGGRSHLIQLYSEQSDFSRRMPDLERFLASVSFR